MKNNILVLISALALSTNYAVARETVLSTEVSSGIDYSNRTFDDSDVEGPVMAPAQDERAQIIISPAVSIFTTATGDSALLNYKPTLAYDLVESESSDINHEASAGYQKDFTDIWDVKIYDVFTNTDDYETNSAQDDSFSGLFVEELTSLIQSADEGLRDDYGRRRYSLNEFDISTGLNYQNDNRLFFGYGWDHLDYDEDETDSETYQNYDKYRVTFGGEHEINPLWTIKGYTQYVRGLYDTDDDGSDDDLEEYHLGAILKTDVIVSHPITLSYAFSASNYDDTDIDNSQIHKLTLGYQLVSLAPLDIKIGAGPTYTKLSDSDDSWDANGNLSLLYRLGLASLSLSSDIGTQFDNFSGTEERALTDYWESKLKLSYPLNTLLQSSVYCGYRDELRNEVSTDAEVNLEKITAGVGLKYRISDTVDADLNYDFTDQDSDNSVDSYDEHSIQLIFSFKTDLLKW